MAGLDGKRALVTGGGTGLGAATALGLARLGASVCVNYSRSAEAAEEVAAKCRDLGVEAMTAQADVSEDADCRGLVERTVQGLGGVDILINNAGITKFAEHSDLDALDADDFMRLYKVNVVSVFQMTRAARSQLEAANKGAVVNISSVAGVTGMGSSVAYAATKGAINTMTLSLARALAPKIRVNAVCPGYIASGWFTKYQGDAFEDRTAERVVRTSPLQVASQPEDIAGTVLFLAGDESAHMTGETLIIDAGLHLGMAPLKAR